MDRSPPETARRLAADESGTWRRLLTDPATGALLDVGEHRYRPAQRLRDFVSARDDTCAFPTCNQPGYRCEYEHIVAYADGGTTSRQNGALACRRHNQAKARTGWSYRHNSDGSYTWTTATGHSYTSAAAPSVRWKPGRRNGQLPSRRCSAERQRGVYRTHHPPSRRSHHVRYPTYSVADRRRAGRQSAWERSAQLPAYAPR